MCHVWINHLQKPRIVQTKQRESQKSVPSLPSRFKREISRMKMKWKLLCGKCALCVQPASYWSLWLRLVMRMCVPLPARGAGCVSFRCNLTILYHLVWARWLMLMIFAFFYSRHPIHSWALSLFLWRGVCAAPVQGPVSLCFECRLAGGTAPPLPRQPLSAGILITTENPGPFSTSASPRTWSQERVRLITLLHFWQGKTFQFDKLGPNFLTSLRPQLRYHGYTSSKSG